jgi:holo-[acyl-carrier protein] synthase
VIGIGTDIVEVARVESVWRRHPERFRRRILTADERQECDRAPEPWRYIAKRYAAKEAIAKAFGTGIGRELGFQDITIARQASGAPRVNLSTEAAALLARRGGREVLVSISDERLYAVAFAVMLA